MTIVFQLLSILGSFASMVGVVVKMRMPGEPWTLLQALLLIAASILVVVAGILIVRNYLRSRPKSMSVGPKVNEYMYNWISQGGLVAIVSRDMSWASSETIRDLLRKKAELGELVLCLPEETELSRELSKVGAKVYTYPELQYTPESRFTIINKGRMDSQLAVGRSRGSRHYIEEFSRGEHPVWSVADDLVNLIINFNRFKDRQVVRE
jgi:hypothetical protein